MEFSRQENGVGSHFLFQGILPTQGLKLDLLHCRQILYCMNHQLSPGKGPPCQCRRQKRCEFDPWVREIPWGGQGNPFQYSCLENPMNRGVGARVHRIAKSWTQLKKQHTMEFTTPVRDLSSSFLTLLERRHWYILLRTIWKYLVKFNIHMLFVWQKRERIFPSSYTCMSVQMYIHLRWTVALFVLACMRTHTHKHTHRRKTSVQFSHSVVSDFLWRHGLQHSRPPCPSPTPRAYSNSCPPSMWCHPTISSSVIPFSSHLQSFPASGSFLTSQFFTSGGQSIGVSASTSVLPMNIQNWFPKIDWLDLLAVQGTLKSLLQHHISKTSILWCSAFFIVQLSHPYMTTG